MAPTTDLAAPRNIVVCCDGTANEIATHPTNVYKLFRALEKGSPGQLCCYHAGVGTMAAPGYVTRAGAWAARMAGLGFGYGLTDDLRDLYCFMMDRWRPGDRLFLFGFSRGAWTVRALGAMLHMHGLVPAGNGPLAPYIVRMLWAMHALDVKHGPDGAAEQRAEYFAKAALFKASFSRPCRPHFMGVWDTVSSVGWFTHPVRLPFTTNNPDIAITRHAVSIDERRAFFRTNLFQPGGKPSGTKQADLREVWFPGVHCDVGGGYAEAEAGLSKLTLDWMLGEARTAGLLLDEGAVATVLGQAGEGYVRPDPDGPMHDELHGAWRLVEPVPRPHYDSVGKRWGWQANHGKPRILPRGAVVHDAAWARGGDYAACLPPGMVRLSQAGWS